MNVPDDWGSYFETCLICGSRYHASEGGCDCTDGKAECKMCEEWKDEDEVEHDTCEDCRECCACGACPADGLTFYEEADEWYCQPCAIADDLIDAVTALATVAPECGVEQPEEAS